MSKLNVSPSHHRKRLADDSHHHPDPPHPDDSEMFIIKLPPNPNYYTKTAINLNAIDDKDKKLSVEFKSNGKPGRIYHWNMPVLKKMVNQQSHHRTNSRYSNDMDDLIDIKRIPTWPKPWENETIEKNVPKTYRRHSTNFAKNKSPSYYVPTRSKKNNSKDKTTVANNAHKYFPGNGKPKSFYILKKKSQKPYYKTIIPWIISKQNIIKHKFC